MIPESYDQEERRLILEIHEQNPELSNDELLDKVRKRTRESFMKLFKGYKTDSPTTHDQ